MADDGVGFEPAAAASAAGGLGLGAMRERVEGLGGQLVVESAPGEGTTVAVEVAAPVGAAQAEPAGTEPR